MDGTVVGDYGTDQLTGPSGNDLFAGGLDADVLSGRGCDDEMLGEGDEDVLAGGGGDDALHGGDANDVLRGGAGEDLLNGGRGVDQLFGAGERDVFVFEPVEGCDRVHEFEKGVDLLDSSAYGFADEDEPRALARAKNGNAVFTLDDGAVVTVDDISINKLMAGVLLQAPDGPLGKERTERPGPGALPSQASQASCPAASSRRSRGTAAPRGS